MTEKRNPMPAMILWDPKEKMKMKKTEMFDHLTDEQKAKALSCKTPKELMDLAMEMGKELTDDQLAAVSGGTTWEDIFGCNYTNDDWC